MKLIIVGAGLGGCTLATQLSNSFDVTLLYSRSKINIRSVGYKQKLLQPTADGLGGTTQLWHNVLIEIDETSLSSEANSQNALYTQYYNQAAELFGLDLEMAKKMVERKQTSGPLSFPSNSGLRFGKAQFIPRLRFNSKTFLTDEVSVEEFDVLGYHHSNGVVTGVSDGVGTIEGDIFVDACGGLGSLRTLGKLSGSRGKRPVEDHYCGFVGSFGLLDRSCVEQIQGRLPTANSWSWRVPIVFRTETGFDIALYLYPSFMLAGNVFKSNNKSLLELRNRQNIVKNLFKMISSPSDMLRIIDFYSLGFFESGFEVFAVLQHPQRFGEVTYYDEIIEINSLLPKQIDVELREAFNCLVGGLPGVKDARFYDACTLDTGAHFSGTFQDLGSTHGSLSNLYVAGGAALGQTGYSNSGLSIVAQAIGLAHRIRSRYLIQ